MAGSQNPSAMLGRSSFLRRFGPIVFVAIMAQSMLSSTVAARPLRANAGERLLTQVSNHGNLLTDYIGASGSSIQFTDVPLASNVQYIFPLAFAIDADASGNTQNGVFSPFWSSSLSTDAATSFVNANPSVKLVASLAGASQFIDAQTTRSVDWYDPPDTTAWINNAVSSITTLAQQYSLSGIDIDYENFPQSSTFTECIGGLITQLKSSGAITVASIAPFGNTLSIYADLFASVGSSIDYVNYQFYADGLNTQSDYVNRYNTVTPSFDASKMMMSVDVGDRGLQDSDFITMAQQVQIAGIMVFDADTSQSTNFEIENLASAYLAT